MATEELNKILLQSLSNEWTKQAYLQGWDLEVIIYKDTCKMFERMEIAEQVYKCGNTSKIPTGQKPTVSVMAVNVR